jgi:hypothetical protein
MRFLFQHRNDLFKVKIARAFNQYGFVFKSQVVKSIHKFGYIFKSSAVDELVFVLRNGFAYANNAVDFVGNNQLRNL